ncbi:F-box-like protein [Ceratobasidium sp. AG-Ba]|nr:F-box-like protein [Ceratobasidium sp. AG-Ba]
MLDLTKRLFLRQTVTNESTDQACLQLQSASSRMANATQEYISACETMQMTCEQHGTGGLTRDLVLGSVDAELSFLGRERDKLDKAESILKYTRNRFRMTSIVYSLPPEILARIFCDAACHCARPESFRRVPLVASPFDIAQVCRQWREIANSYRPLWTHYDLIVAHKNYTSYRYPPADLLLQRSQNDPLELHIRCYDSWHERGDSDYLEEDSDDSEYTAYELMLDIFHPFLGKILPHVCSMVLVFNGPEKHTLNRIIDMCFLHGSAHSLKMFQVQVDRKVSSIPINKSLRPVASRSTGVRKPLFDSLEILHLNNVIPVLSIFNLSSITSLHLEVGWNYSMAQPELASLLKSSPKLRSLLIEGLEIVEDHRKLYRGTIRLNELQNLSVVDYDNGSSLLNTLLAIIAPGPKLARLSVRADFSQNAHETLSALRTFINNSSVTRLDIRGSTESGYLFASQLGTLTRIKTLVMSQVRFSDKAKTLLSFSNKIHCINNPTPLDVGVTLWPSLQNLYLYACTFEESHTTQLLSAHSVSALYWRKCYVEGAHLEPIGIKPTASEADLRFLSTLASKVVHFKDGWTSWP